MNTNHQYIVGLVVVALVVAGMFWYVTKHMNETTAEPSATSTPKALTPEEVEAKEKAEFVENKPMEDGVLDPILLGEEPSLPTVITYSEKGFSPAVIRLQVGGSIVFVNESEKPFWPVAQDNPPSFDAGKPISPNGTFEFTFIQAGSWGYQNSLETAHIGVIVVE